MLTVSVRKASKGMVSASLRMFSAVSGPKKPIHHHKDCPPSERKIRRDNEKKARQQVIEQCKKLDEEAAQSGFEKPWVCRLSLIVERQPIVFGQPPEWYTKFEEIREKRRLDKQMPPYNKIVDSILNDKEESISSDSKDDIEMQKLHEASTSDITPADKANDRTSLLRNTPGFLYLMIHGTSGWAFPSLEYDSEKYKTTRKALERLAVTTYGKDLQLFFWGYPPCFHTARKYSSEEQEKKKAFGEKVFYYRAARLIGDVDLLPSAGKEFNWITLKEFPEYIKDDNLISLFNRVLEYPVCFYSNKHINPFD